MSPAQPHDMISFDGCLITIRCKYPYCKQLNHENQNKTMWSACGLPLDWNKQHQYRGAVKVESSLVIMPEVHRWTKASVPRSEVMLYRSLLTSRCPSSTVGLKQTSPRSERCFADPTYFIMPVVNCRTNRSITLMKVTLSSGLHESNYLGYTVGLKQTSQESKWCYARVLLTSQNLWPHWTETKISRFEAMLYRWLLTS